MTRDTATRSSNGTLYGALPRLLADGWIERIDSNDKVRDKQFYRLTSTGMAALESEVARMNSLTRAATSRMSPPLELSAGIQG